MNFLGAYSDSDDSDSESRPHLQSSDDPIGNPTPPSMDNNMHVKKKGTGDEKFNEKKTNIKKKKKKLDISFLPDDIQAALTRGGDDSSGDESHDYMTSSGLSTSSNYKTLASSLFARLPEPQHSKVENRNESCTKLSVASEESKNISVPVQSVLLESDSDSDSEDEIILKDHESGALPSTVNSTNSLNIKSSKPSNFPPQNSDNHPSQATLSNMQRVMKPSASADSTSLGSAADILSTSSLHTITPQVSGFQPGGYSAQPPIQHYCHQQQISQAKQDFYQQSNVIYQEPYRTVEHVPAKKSRKRERDIQNLLLHGNVSAAMNMSGGNMVEVRRDSTWDDSRYREQKKKEEELKSMFGSASGNNMIAQPTKNQNRKHQINSLAFSAAESELELLEARGRQYKTKAETQAKYGW